jgi:hypothetical protein
VPHIDVHKRVYLGAGHHRRPRNAQAWVEPYSASAYDGTTISETADDTLAFTPMGGSSVLNANFAFWSRLSASSGRTQTSPHFAESPVTEDLNLIAWYYLPPSGGTNGNGTAELIDAYSVAAGDFIDDDFVTVASDPSLTVAANVDGDVPTAVPETLDAYATVASTGERFDQWIVSPDGTTASGQELDVPQRADGFAFATYDHPPSAYIPRVPINAQEGVIILTGIINDAPGWILVDGHPVPVDPGWGSILREIFSILGMQAQAGRLSKQGGAQLRTALGAEMSRVATRLGQLAKSGFAARE